MKELIVIFSIFVALLIAYLEYDSYEQIKKINEKRKAVSKKKTKQSNQ
jgi:hypothetical protein